MKCAHIQRVATTIISSEEEWEGPYYFIIMINIFNVHKFTEKLICGAVNQLPGKEQVNI